MAPTETAAPKGVQRVPGVDRDERHIAFCNLSGRQRARGFSRMVDNHHISRDLETRVEDTGIGFLSASLV